jgi:uncharacterized protein YjbI with pentapeptide repeats
MFDIQRYIYKFKQAINVDEVVKILEKLPQDSALQQISQNAGLVGSIINVGVHVIEKIYESKIPIQTRLSFTLTRMMLESAKDSLQFDSDVKIENILTEDKDSEEMENIVVESLNPKYYEDTYARNAITYLPDHPIIVKFRNMLKKGISDYNSKNGSNISISLFLTEFNTTLLKKLEEERNSNKDLEKLLYKWKVNSDFHNLLIYLENAKNLFFEPNKVDRKSLSEYYVQNKIHVVDRGTWDRDEIEIQNKKEWKLDSFLKSRKSIEVIAAPFGIGKSSLGKKIAYDCATKFIQDPTDPDSYIPIFVPLKFELESTSNDNSLKNDLHDITSLSDREKNTKVLVILDGLDELPTDRQVDIYNIYATLQELIKDYPNVKFIITTRLESGFPTRLNIKDSYVRLFSFDTEQVKQFFKIYGISENLDKLSQILDREKLGKPLFCWMVASVYNNSSPKEREILFASTTSHILAEIYLYQQFIHNVVLGKPRDVAKEEFEEWFRRSKDEKRALRLVAFMKNEFPSLYKSKAKDILDLFKFSLPKSSESFLSTYFSTKHDEQGTEKLEFIHKSFQEYLLAEFYIESVINRKYYRLMGSEPSRETYLFIQGLIEFVTNNEKNIKKYAEDLINTFYEDNQKIELEAFIKDLKSNSTRFVKEQKLVLDSPREESLWNLWQLEFKDLKKIWVSKWIGVFIAGNVARKYQEIVEEEFLKCSSFIISNSGSFIENKFLIGVYLPKIYLRDANLTRIMLYDADLSRADLSRAYLSGAGLSGAGLSRANLRDADLLNANLSRANLSRADLSGAGLSRAYLSGANLSGADLSGSNLRDADLSGANLSGAGLSRAYLSGANLRDANLSGANLSGAGLSRAGLSRANLSRADLSGANLSGAGLSRANLSGAGLSRANLSRADLSGADLQHAKLIDANLRDADLSGADLRDADLSGADLRDADLSRADFSGADLTGGH